MNKDILMVAKDLVIACERVYNRKLQTGSGGNVSARIPGTEHMLVKASGGSMGDCVVDVEKGIMEGFVCLLYTSPSPRDRQKSRMPSSA